MNVVSGSLVLAPGETVVLDGWAIDDTAADLGLYAPSGAFSDSEAMLDFTQWGSAGNGRESVAVTKGIWTAGDFMDDLPEYCYTGNGTTENGRDQWEGHTCSAGTSAPVVSDTAEMNACPATTVDISDNTTSTAPTGAVLEWHTAASPTDNSTKVPDPTAVGVGTYYAVFYDATNDCYSPGSSTGVTVNIDAPCCSAPSTPPNIVLPGGN